MIPNSFDQIEKNQTISFLPKFEGLEVFKEKSCILIVQGDNVIKVPIAMRQAFLDCLKKAGA